MDTATDRTALVVGGGGGIGRQIAITLAERGFAVAVADVVEDDAIETAKLVEEAGGTAGAAFMDITDLASTVAASHALRTSLGPFAVAVVASGWDVMHPFLETDEVFWRKVVEVNYLGVVRVASVVLPEMVEQRWGRIINIGSDAGRVGSSLEAVYSGAKGGVIAFTKAIARENAKFGITANTVCPGPTETAMLTAVMGEQASASKVMEGMKKAIPLRRLGMPSDVAATVAFLASPAAGYITGQTISVNGGLNMV